MREASPVSGALRPRPGPVLLLLTVSVAVLATLLDLRVPQSSRTATDIDAGWTVALPGIAMAWAGAVVLAWDRRHRVGWLLSAFGLWWALDGLAASWLMYATLEQPTMAGASAAFWFYQRMGAGVLMVLPLLLVLYPDGRLPSGAWRVPAVVGCAAMALLPLVLVSVPASLAQEMSGDGPLPEPFRGLDLDVLTVPLPDGVWRVLLRLAYVSLAVGLVPALAVVVHRYRTARHLDRTRMRWLLWAAVVDALVIGMVSLFPGSFSDAGITVAVIVTAGSAAVGITRPDAVDVDRLLGGTLLYGALLVLTFVIDLVVVGVAGRLLGGRLDDDQALLVAVFVVALVYTPLRHRLWRLVRVRVLGQRHDPYAVVSALAERLEDSAASEQQLSEVARSVAAAFRSPYVGVELRQRTGRVLLAEHGERPADTRSLPITYRTELIGRLLLPAAGLPGGLRRSDERLLADLVRQAAAAARADLLAAELQQSRERLVTAVEDERRRLRRELHDGLGPALAAVASRIDTARIVARRDPDAADAALGQARREVTDLLGEVRRLVHGLRPPALDDVGLVRAVRQMAEHIAPPGLAVSVEAPDDLTGLPAAVEVAAYRIISESLTNVVRHAAASRCEVRLAVEDQRLEVEVRDDGEGIADDVRAGVGLLSLRERADELGGEAEVVAVHPHGTRVRAVLPTPGPRLTPPVEPAGEGARS